MKFSQRWWVVVALLFASAVSASFLSAQTEEPSVVNAPSSAEVQSDSAAVQSSSDESEQKQPTLAPNRDTALAADVETDRRFNELRRELLDDRAKTIDWWLMFIAIIIPIIVIIGGIFSSRRFTEIKDEAQRHVEEIKARRDEADSLVKGMNALEGKEPDLAATREPYETFKHYNDRIDRDTSVEARVDEEGDRPVVVFSIATGSHEEPIELRVELSRLLYGTDRQFYIEVLKATNPVPMVTVDEAKEHKEEEELTVSKPDDTPAFAPVEAVGPVPEVISVYGGTFDTLRSSLKTFLTLEGVNPTVASAGEEQLIDSLLATVDKNMALDWKIREPIQARLKVSCKRVLVRFGTEPEKADEVAKRMVAWLHQQATNESFS